MKLKTFFWIGVLIFILLFSSEVANYLSNPASQSVASLNTYLIKKSVSEAKKGKFDSSLSYLDFASRINVFGEYDHYRKLLPEDYSKKNEYPGNEGVKTGFLKYIAGLDDSDLKNSEDQGLGVIYYNLGLIAWNNSETELTENMFKKAMYNNPEFASFHVELINFYFRSGNNDKTDAELEYCLKFAEAKTMCESYDTESISINTPREIGFLKDVVSKHYSSF